jgi:DNA-binding NtrC family response regulator
LDYLTKPFEPQAARAVVLKALGRSTVPATAAAPDVPTPKEEVLPGMLAMSAAMRELSALAKRIASSDATAVLMGETGTGKELLARAIHRLSPRSGQRFVAVNCAAIPTELLESEFFGYAKGAFTGPPRTTWDFSRALIEERSFWTRSESCHDHCRQSSRALWKSAPCVD